MHPDDISNSAQETNATDRCCGTRDRVRRELGYAEANQTSIFPLLVEGKEQTAIPLRLITHQFIDARRNYEDGLGRLVAVIREHLRILPE